MEAPKISYQPLGASGLKVSKLWLGTMMFGDQTDAAEAANIVDATRDAGVNAIDTANAYANGESERITDKLIAADRERWILATKLANPMGPGPNDRGLSRRHIMAAVDASLQRLGTDFVDVLYLHREDASTPLEETLAAVATLIERGKVHHFGLSNFRAWRIARVAEMCRAMGMQPPVVCQPPYNAMSRQIETELLPCCAHYGIGAVVYSPLARGVLSGKYQPGAEPPAGSRAARNDPRIMQTEFRPESLALAAKMAEHAKGRGLTATQLALGAPFSAEDEAFVSALVSTGHASTPGYHDPQYPVTGRAPRAG